HTLDLFADVISVLRIRAGAHPIPWDLSPPAGNRRRQLRCERIREDALIRPEAQACREPCPREAAPDPRKVGERRASTCPEGFLEGHIESGLVRKGERRSPDEGRARLRDRED